MTASRDAVHVLMISLGAQLDLIEALLISGTLAPAAARHLIAQIDTVVQVWGRGHADIAQPVSDVAAGLLAQIERGQA